MSNASNRPLNLLLLPPPPRPAEHESLFAAYKDPLTSLFRQLSELRKKEPTGSILEVALPCPSLSRLQKPRATLFSHVQAHVGGVYKLICMIAAQEGINIEDQAGLDVRIIIVSYAGARDGYPQESDAITAGLVSAVVNLQTLARSYRKWNTVYSCESEEGETMLQRFLVSQDGRVKIRRIKGGLVGLSPDATAEEDKDGDKIRHHHHIAVGGTFDHMHVGHKLLLTMFSYLLGHPDNEGDLSTLTIGITGDELLKDKKYAELLEDWDRRQHVVIDFMRTIMDFRPPEDLDVKTETKNDSGANGHVVETWLGDRNVVKCVELSDPFGPTITVESISALVISAETRKGGKAVNDKRQEKGWSDLGVFEVDVLDPNEATDNREQKDTFEDKLSSTHIRQMLSERRQQEQASKA